MSILLLIQETGGRSLSFICLEALLETGIEMLIGHLETISFEGKDFSHCIICSSFWIYILCIIQTVCALVVFVNPLVNSATDKGASLECVIGQGTSFPVTLCLTAYINTPRASLFLLKGFSVLLLEHILKTAVTLGLN